MNKKIAFSICITFLYAITTVAQTNFNFEAWTNGEPDGWITFNNSIPGIPQTAFQQSTNPGQGNNSIKLKTTACPTCPSYMLSDPLGGIVSLGMDGYGIPFTQKPISVDFKFKSFPLNGDMTGFEIQLTRWDNINQRRETIGQAWYESEIQVSNWTNVNLPISYVGNLLPDTLFMAAYSSVGHSAITNSLIPAPVIGSEFYLDDIKLTLPSCAGFSINVTGTNETAPFANNGSAQVNASGGSAPYSYAWSTLSTSQSISGLSPGVYNVTTTDANGCVKNSSYNVLKGGCNNLSVTVTGTNTASFTANNGIATANVTGGTPPYTYIWNTGDTTPQTSNLNVGAYAVLVTDNTGLCTQYGYYTIYAGNNIQGLFNLTKNQLNTKFYPNPSNGIFNIKSNDNVSEITITNALGEVIYKSTKIDKTNSIDLSNYPKGMYLYHLKTITNETENGILIVE